MKQGQPQIQIANRGQHPYKHKAQEIRYNNPSHSSAATVDEALDQLYSGVGTTFRDNNVFTGDQGTVVGGNTTFTLPSTPVLGSEHVYLNGIRMNPTNSFTSDMAYMISGAVITFNQVITDPTWIVLVDYRE